MESFTMIPLTALYYDYKAQPIWAPSAAFCCIELGKLFFPRDMD